LDVPIKKTGVADALNFYVERTQKRNLVATNQVRGFIPDKRGRVRPSEISLFLLKK
jgi:hypothetical protein